MAKKKRIKSEKLTIQRKEEEKKLEEMREDENSYAIQYQFEKEKTNEQIEIKKYQEKEIKSVELDELNQKFEDMVRLFDERRKILWEEKNWHRYLYMSHDLNPLLLPEVNAYLSEWDADDNYNIMHIFQECSKCLKMSNEIEFALLECPELELSMMKSWIESIKNLHFMIRKKCEIATFLILRNAHEYQNDESYNMEFGVSDSMCKEEDKDNSPLITLCLWGNLSKNARHKGMDLPSLGYNFELPPDLIKIGCAVRILHTSFDNVTPLIQKYGLLPKRALGKLPELAPYQASVFEEISFDLPKLPVEDVKPQLDIGLSSLAPSDLISAAKQSSLFDPSSPKIEDKNPPDMVFTPPEEPEITIMNEEEYFAVGGVFHFELFQLPTPIVKSGCWVFTYCEDKVLKRIPHKTSIIPIRHPKPDMSPAVAAEFADSEIKRFEKEMCDAISVTFKLPNNVLFLEHPMPSFWVSDKKGFTTIGFFDTKHDEVLGFVMWKNST